MTPLNFNRAPYIVGINGLINKSNYKLTCHIIANGNRIKHDSRVKIRYMNINKCIFYKQIWKPM